MGLFQQRPEEHQDDWTGLPSEPLDPKSPAEALDAASVVEPFAVDFTGTTSSIVFPIAPPAAAASDSTTGEPEDPASAAQ